MNAAPGSGGGADGDGVGTVILFPWESVAMLSDEFMRVPLSVIDA